MIDPRYLDRIGPTLRVVGRLELEPAQWERIASLVAALAAALRRDDQAELVKVLAGLERTGAARSFQRRERDGLLERSAASDRDPTPVPAAVAAILDDAEEELGHAAAEIARVAHIDVDAALPLEPGTRLVAEVYLDTSPPREGEVVDAFVLSDPPPWLELLEVQVWLTASEHFSIVSPPIGTLVLRADQARSTSARFEVVVDDAVPAGAGEPALRARFDYNLRAGGSVRRTLPVRGVPVTPGEGGATGVLRIDGRAEACDLKVEVLKVAGRSGCFKAIVSTRHLGGVVVEDDWVLDGGAEAFVLGLMGAFTDPTATPTGRRHSLQGAGRAFFKDSPRAFQELFWRLVDADLAPRAVSVISEEAAVPWELMIPHRRDAAQNFQELSPLGVMSAVARWQKDVSARQRVPLSDSLVLAPDYRPPKTLPNAAAEKALVLAQYAGSAVPATYDELDQFLEEADASLLHFVCHGRDGTLQALGLEGRQALEAQQVGAGGLGRACRARRPLVFLNACEVGRPGVGLASFAGFPAAFIAEDAAGVIAPLWAVADTVAHEVARTFYDVLDRQPQTPFAEILRGIRARAYAEGGEDSFAAYCYYGDPLAAAEAGS